MEPWNIEFFLTVEPNFTMTAFLFPWRLVTVYHCRRLYNWKRLFFSTKRKSSQKKLEVVSNNSITRINTTNEWNNCNNTYIPLLKDPFNVFESLIHILFELCTRIGTTIQTYRNQLIRYYPFGTLNFPDIKKNECQEPNQPVLLLFDPPDDPQHTTGANKKLPKFLFTQQMLKSWYLRTCIQRSMTKFR